MSDLETQTKPDGGASVSTAMLERRWPWSHRYDRWEDTHTVTKSRASDDTVVAEGVLQQRRCCKCGKLQMRTVWA